MSKKNDLRQTLLVIAVILIVASMALIKLLSPYGEKYLPQWVAMGDSFVSSIEEFKEERGYYPKDLPFSFNLNDIPGCRDVIYKRHKEEDGSVYFTIHMVIHLREAVLYDSRKNLNASSSWGTYATLGDWMWTKD